MKIQRILLYAIISFSWCLLGWNWGDILARKTKKGNELFATGQYEEALKEFTEADVNSQAGDSRLPQLYKNMGNTLTQQGRHEQAIAMYQKALEVSNNASFKADVQYNTANTWLQQRQYQQALEAYQQALELDPKHLQAQQNKELVEKLIVEPPQQQQQQNQKDQNNQEQQDQQQQQSQNQQEEQKPEDEQQDQQESEEQQQREEQPQQSQEQQASEAQESPEDKEQQLSKEEALRILDALEEKEELQQNRIQLPPRPVEKDW